MRRIFSLATFGCTAIPARARHGLPAALAGLAMAASLGMLAAPARAEPAPPELVKVGVFTVAPYVVAGPDGPQGALIEFFDREIAPRMGVRFQWQRPVTVARLEHSLASGDVLFAPILAHTPERDRSAIQFDTDVHIRFVPCIAMLPEHRPGAIHGPGDLAGMTIGWVQAGALPPFMRDPRIRLDLVGGVDWEKINLGKLKLGRIDGAYFSNCASAQYHAARNGLKLNLLPLPVQGVPLHGAFAPSAPAQLVQRYRKAAQQAFAAGRFDSYVNRTLGETRP
ncbi:MAG TPA: transporter substrate-binding domain-containing protein [Burkholderiaceae bacterium]|nr:transporter substrate-binding domain-containing protein [Burkholderiaceae bacterium]